MGRPQMAAPLFTVYSKTDCEYCVRAVDMILDLVGGENVDRVHVIKNPAAEIVSGLKDRYNHRTYPFIFVGDVFIGGYTDLIIKMGIVERELNQKFGFQVDF